MAFDPSAYQVPQAKPLPVVLLLDVSGSMYGAKIEALYTATKEMIHTFAQTQTRELEVQVSIITFGKRIELHTPFIDAQSLDAKGIEPFVPDGPTPIGIALRMAKDMLEDSETTPSPSYIPAVVLVSDGLPTDSWEDELNNFIHTGKSSKTQRFAVGIQEAANSNVLRAFTGNANTIFNADGADGIIEYFKTISMSISTRVKSNNPNELNLYNISSNHDAGIESFEDFHSNLY